MFCIYILFSSLNTDPDYFIRMNHISELMLEEVFQIIILFQVKAQHSVHGEIPLGCVSSLPLS